MLKFSDIEKYTIVRGPAEEERAAGVIGLVGARADGTMVMPDGSSPVSGGGYVGPQLLTISIGNSINSGVNNGTTRNQAEGVDPLGYWSIGSDLHIANMYADCPMRFGRITPTTRADKWGHYSWPGALLGAINGDLPEQLYGALDTAGIKPDLIVGHSLFENDVSNNRTFAQMKADLQQFVYTARGRYPSARIWLCTPRPSFSYSTPAMVSAYQQITDYMLSMDDGKTTFVSRMNGYEDPANPGVPLLGYTDVSVHPNVAGGWVNGKGSLLPTLRRIADATFLPHRSTSVNFALTGSIAATGTNVSGTTPTGTLVSGSASIVSLVATANQPGATYVLTQSAGQLRDSGNINLGNHPVSGFTLYSPYIKIRINSGGEQLRMVALQPRGTDGVTLPFYKMHATGTSDPDVGAVHRYEDGDVLTLRCPPIGQADFGTAGALTSIYTYLRLERKTGATANVLTSGSVSVTVLDAGVTLVS